MIVVKTSDSRLFEEAYFVLRRDCREGENDMVAEANRIIEGCGGKMSRGGVKRLKRWMVSIAIFLGGSAFGGGLACALGLLV